MKVGKVKEVVARMLGIGKKRVWIDPERVKDVEGVMTKDDIRRLMDEGIIRILQKGGQSRYRANILREKKRAGRRRGPGSKKGKRYDEKKEWIKRVRALRRALKILRRKGIVGRKLYRSLYMKVKGDFIRSKSHLTELVRGS